MIQIQVAIAARGAAPEIIEEDDLHQVLAGAPVAVQCHPLRGSCGVRGAGGPHAADLLSINTDKVLSISLEGILRDVEEQPVRTTAELNTNSVPGRFPCKGQIAKFQGRHTNQEEHAIIWQPDFQAR
jgi:hypothetical protein